MPISMTGFGRAVSDTPLGKLTVEIQSINRKYLEVGISLPKEFSRFEQEIRTQVGESVSRGGVTVRIFLQPKEVEDILPDPELLKGLKGAFEKIAKKIGADSKEITLPFLMQYLPASFKQESSSDEDLSHLKRGVALAVKSLISMKKVEGEALTRDLNSRLDHLEKILKEIEQITPDATQKMRQKLQERLAEIFACEKEMQERLLREIALFAERVDVSEEITRFRSHMAQFKTMLKEAVVGRKMDFLIQEFGREINTIGSKAMDAKIAHLVVDVKSELEKMREQIQNLE
jgi:uncharacterized protein (TIGR00255 family)